MTVTEQVFRQLDNIKRLEKTISKTPVNKIDSLESKFLLLDAEKSKLQEIVGMAVTE